MGLWNYLKDRKGTLVDWNEDGEVSVHGQSIIGSHMIDLVKHAVTRLAKKRSLGYSLQGFMYFHLKIFFFV